MNFNITEYDVLIDDLLDNQSEIDVIANKLHYFNLPNLDYKLLFEYSESVSKIDLDSREADIIDEICVPLKRNNFLREAHNVYKYLYYKYGASAKLYRSWYKTLASACMFNEANLIIVSACRICDNVLETYNYDSDERNQCLYHSKEIIKVMNKEKYWEEYLLSVAGIDNYKPIYINLDKIEEFDYKNENIENAKRKKCPFCAEDIAFEAIKCRFCGERLDKGNNIADSLVGSKDKIIDEKVKVTESKVNKQTNSKDEIPTIFKFFAVLLFISGIISLVFTGLLTDDRSLLATGRWEGIVTISSQAIVVLPFILGIIFFSNKKPSKILYVLSCLFILIVIILTRLVIIKAYNLEFNNIISTLCVEIGLHFIIYGSIIYKLLSVSTGIFNKTNNHESVPGNIANKHSKKYYVIFFLLFFFYTLSVKGCFNFIGDKIFDNSQERNIKDMQKELWEKTNTDSLISSISDLHNPLVLEGKLGNEQIKIIFSETNWADSTTVGKYKNIDKNKTFQMKGKIYPNYSDSSQLCMVLEVYSNTIKSGEFYLTKESDLFEGEFIDIFDGIVNNVSCKIKSGNLKKLSVKTINDLSKSTSSLITGTYSDEFNTIRGQGSSSWVGRNGGTAIIQELNSDSIKFYVNVACGYGMNIAIVYGIATKQGKKYLCKKYGKNYEDEDVTCNIEIEFSEKKVYVSAEPCCSSVFGSWGANTSIANEFIKIDDDVRYEDLVEYGISWIEDFDE